MSDALFTEQSLLLLTHSLYNRSSIMRKYLDLWGIAAMSESFRFGSGLSLIEFHETCWQRPSMTRFKVSILRAVAVFGTSADTWGPLLTAAYILVTVQSLL